MVSGPLAMRRKAFILGAGVSGLVAGWKLAERGWEVAIFERDAQVGGMARSWRWGDFILDVGPHIYHTPDPALAAAWERDFGDLFVKGAFYCANVKGAKFDRFYHYPLSYEGLSAEFDPATRVRVIDELGKTSEADRRLARTFAEYVRGLVGPTLQEMFFENYPRKVWGLATSDMTANWAPKRIEIRQTISEFYAGQWNAVGKYGTGCVLDRIRDRTISAGGRIELGTGVAAMETAGGKIDALRLEDGRRIAVALGDIVISTVPISALCRMLGGSSRLSFRGIASVYVAVDRPRILPGHFNWLYFDDPALAFNRVTEPKSMAPDVAPAGRSFLVAEIAYSAGDAVDRATDDDLVARVVRDLATTGLIAPNERIETSINRQPAVYPLLTKDYQVELARARELVGRFDQVHSIGTTGEFNYADIQILFQKAGDLIDLLTDGKSDLVGAVRRPRVYRLNAEFEIGGRRIGPSHKPFIVAEAGLNHNGNVDLALRLVDAAAAAGCDAVKFQTFRAEDRVSAKVLGANYAEQIVGMEENLYQVLARLQLKADDHRRLAARARDKGILFFSTPFAIGDVALLEEIGVPCYKIASADIGNLPLLRRVASTGKPMIVSTGMATLAMVEEALEAIRAAGNANVALMHCISSYPAAPEDTNLRTIETLVRAFGVPVGFSDHTLGLLCARIALARGAALIERHFTLSRDMEGPDHILSSEPDEMRTLVREAALVPIALGDGIKRITGSEYATITTQRKALFAARDIAEGDVLDEAALSIKGPGVGIAPRFMTVVLGRRARRRVAADHPITWDDI